MRLVRALACASAAALPMTVLAACGGEERTRAGASPAGGGGAVAIEASDNGCEVAKKEYTAGTIDFRITNRGREVTEVYVYAPGDKIMTERENIRPGTTVTLTVQLGAGNYQIACEPGMTPPDFRQDITVSGQADHATDPRLARALTGYRAYVVRQTDDSIAKARAFVAAFKKGDVAEAKRLYAPSRVGWERIEPVAESFGDLDPRVDAREADLEPGQKWTGWHRLEKALWKTGSTKGEEGHADRLLKDLGELRAKVTAAQLDPPITPASMANGAKELLDEVATGKITGEEEAFSHTDLVDFKANVDGARTVYDLLKVVVLEKDPALAKELDGAFAEVDGLLKKYEKSGGFGGYVSYDTVGKAQRKELSDAVNALGEPLSRLAASVVR
ncbi:iron uptake system protein EfeO [Spirillospora sp. NPDC029432]|uniref:iron uptake system protein EfeO n=1 Tax=Spirillospora sp. NPDC029432 TaxID=3154599 RepID=UPI003453CFE6